MINRYLFTTLVLFLFLVSKSFSQRKNYDIVNGIGIFGGITNIDIITDNFVTKSGQGFIGGLSATVDIPNKWYNLSYGMQLSDNTFSISVKPELSSTDSEFIDYNLIAAQLALLMHIKLAGSYVTLDAGPMLQYNSLLELEDSTQENYFINNYDNLTALDITNISQFNINTVVGITAGFKAIKLRAHYIYGATNTLKKLESESLDTAGGDSRFKGNLSMFIFGAMISF